MLFTTFSFGLLVITALWLYYLPALRRWQVPVLILASLTFYVFNQADLLWLLLLSVSINIGSSYCIVYDHLSRQRFHATWGVVANLSILVFFKYGPLLGRTFFPTDTSVGAWLVMLPLPIGISFFTFQGISLLIDTYRNRDVAAFRSLIAPSLWQHAQTVLFFKSFFPQLIAGPIVKAYSFLPQIKPKYGQDINWEYCFRTLTVGYFLKMVVADNLKDHTALMVYPYFETWSSLTLLALLFGYSMQIFADFAGYSLIALGLAALFGYSFPANFNFPYVASSFSDFWRRWHISLSNFLREYLYIPLGGNRRGVFRTYANLMLTMILGGLWHGAAWSYAVWGLTHGLALAAERWLTDRRLLMPTSTAGRLLKSAWVFCYVTAAWLLFKLPSFSQVIAYVNAIVLNQHKPHDWLAISFVALYSIPVIAYHVHYQLSESSLAIRPMRWRFIPYGLMLFMILTNSGSNGTFIYFQF